MKFSIEVQGQREVIGALNRLNLAASNRVIEVVKASSKNIRRGARSRVARRTGKFARRIRTKFSKDGLTGETAAFTRGGRPHPLSHLLEFGTKAHVIVPEKRKDGSKKGALAIGGAGGMGPRRLVSKVNHPGTPAKPWLFPAYEEERPNYVNALRGALNQAGKDAAR